MKSLKKEKYRQPMSLAKKIALCVLGIALVIGIIYLSYYLIHYVFYDRYKDYLTSYEVEEGKDFQPKKETKADVADMVLVEENDILKLYTDMETANVAVYDKRNGKTIYSNPLNPDEDSMANVTNKNYLKSQFILSYYNKEVISGTYDSYSMSVERGQVTAESIENGIRYIYKVGDFEGSKNGTVPTYITKEKLEEICLGLDEKDAKSLTRYYIESALADELLELNGVALKNVKTIQKIQKWLDGIGWTQEDYEEQMEVAGEETNTQISFQVALDYRLNEDGLDVSIPVSMIEEYGGGSIFRIQLLRTMGAAGQEENGYIVVPNGSGSIINFNNNKTSAASYAQYVYDIDPLAANFTTVEFTESAKLPLFGICREDSSVLVTIEDGETLSHITAGISGVYNDYNYAYPTFVLRVADYLGMFGDSTSDVFVLEPDMYDTNLSVKYTFLTEENSGYAGLANYYRNRLIEEGKLNQTAQSGDIPFYYDIIGGVKETDHVLGVQWLKTFPMTTFDQAGEISNELAAEGISNQVMNFQGWFNGGYYHDTPDKIKVLRKLGGKSDLEKLNQTVASNGGNLFADVAFQRVTFADDGFNYSAESSRYYGAGYVVNFGFVNPGTLRATSGLGYMETKYDLLSPKYLPRYVEAFSKKIDKFDVAGISLRDLGSNVHSDKKRNHIINRQEALDILLGQFEILKETDKKLMTNNADQYSFAYSSDIINTPITHNEILLVDADIPLYQMIIHGSINYSTALLNYYDEEDNTGLILNMIEYGAAPHYMFTWEESSRMKNTGLNRFYATTYDVWKQEAIDVYSQVNEALKYVTDATIVDHEIVNEDVRKVTYSNGVTIFVNYGDQEETIDGISIPAKDYRMEGN